MASIQSASQTNNQDTPANNTADDGTTLFLGDLSVYSTENHIRELFQSYGKIENIRIKRGNTTKPHLCYGFIKFENKACAERALAELNGVMFLGRTLRVGWAEKKAQTANAATTNTGTANPQSQTRPPMTGNTIAPKGNSKNVETAQIHVSFISKQIDALISESTLRSLFGMYGEVVDVAIKKSQFDKKLKLQNGYGFVHYRLDDQGIQSAIQATSAIHQVTIDRVTYDCSLSHSLEVIMQQQGYQMPVVAAAGHNEASHMDQMEASELHMKGDDQGGELDQAHYAGSELPDPSLSTAAINSYQPENPATVAPVDSAAVAAFPMLQAPVLEVSSGHYQIQNAPDAAAYPIASKDLTTTLEFFPNFQHQPPDPFGGFPHLAGANPFHQAALSYSSAANAAYLNPAGFQLGMFYPPGAPGADFSSHLFAPPPPMSASPMPNPSFYDDKGMMAAAGMANSSFHLTKPFDGLGGLGAIGLGGFEAGGGHTPNGLSDYQSQAAAVAAGMPFPSLHNPFQTTNFEPIMFPSLSTGIMNEDGTAAAAAGSNPSGSGSHFTHHHQQHHHQQQQQQSQQQQHF